MEIIGNIVKSLNIDGNVVIAQAIAFAILVVLLLKYLYRPVESILRQREDQIANSLNSAEAQKTAADSLKQEYEAKLANIADEAQARLDQAVKDAEAARLRLLENAQTEIQGLHERHQAQLALEREQLRRELRSELAEIAVSAATKALRNQITPAIQSAVVDQVIGDLDKPSSL